MNERRWGRLFVAVTMTAFAGAFQAQTPSSTVPAWQIAAGGKQAFEVASVRLSKPGTFQPPSFAISADNSFRDPDGLFHADFPVMVYISFAYKLMLTREQQSAILGGLPKWVGSDRFAVEARVPQHVTKDQIRLMMQSLLAERFHLQMHFEQKEVPVLAMTLIKPGVLGPRLLRHEDGPPCEVSKDGKTVTVENEQAFPEVCDVFSAMPKGTLMLTGARDSTMDLLAGYLGDLGGRLGFFSLPVVDRTGLPGHYDFSIEIAPPKNNPSAEEPDAGPDLLEAMREQLGLKLQQTRAQVSLPVIDHVEALKEN